MNRRQFVKALFGTAALSISGLSLSKPSLVFEDISKAADILDKQTVPDNDRKAWVSESFVEAFNREVMAEYESRGVLKNFVRVY